MTSTALIEPPELDSDEVLAELPPLLGVVPVAGPPVFVLVGFGGVLLLLLVPPITLLATIIALALFVAAATVALAALTGAIVAAPFVLMHSIRGHRLPHVSLPFPHVHNVKVRRV